jgi:hypothetical protein
MIYSNQKINRNCQNGGYLSPSGKFPRNRVRYYVLITKSIKIIQSLASIFVFLYLRCENMKPDDSNPDNYLLKSSPENSLLEQCMDFN